MRRRWAGGEDRPDGRHGGARMVRVAGLLDAWVCALPGVAGKLTVGATVADVGCGCGGSTIALARRYPESRFWGFDTDRAAIRTAGECAADGGVADRIR